MLRMNEVSLKPTSESGRAVEIICHDGQVLGGHIWSASDDSAAGTIIINPATGVLARYYHRYARFLTRHGFDVLTYDYRGIGASRPDHLQQCGFRWRDWGTLDFDAAVRFMRARRTTGPLIVVGHSVGGFLPGLADSAPMIDRMLTVGAQYAWWGDYAPRQRLRLFVKWHLVMPTVTALYGYFPGRKLGWLEDLPAGVANEWSFRGPRFEHSHPRGERLAILSRMAAVTAPILAVAVSDDELGTIPAIRRTLGYYTHAPRTVTLLKPSDYSRDVIGHFNLFHDSHTAGFWRETLAWLKEGRNPWQTRVMDRISATGDETGASTG
jgi:predicted alpha/beta hydrolase